MIFSLFQQSTELLIAVIFCFGMLVGSFLNVVIFRLPIMLQHSWQRDCRQYLNLPQEASTEPLNLLWPGSHCTTCKTSISAWQNIPVISYVLLRGKCHHCAAAISLRYPLIEALTGICSAVIAWRFGYGTAMLCALVLTWCLIALSFIDIDHQLLPDSITLPLIWLGLLLSLWNIFIDSHTSIIGAVCGYLSLWSVYHLFKLLTGKEGMGYGDFKLLAIFGAWLGWQYLPQIILLSSVVGAIIGSSLIIFKKQAVSKPIPFGPYLAAAGWLALIWGREINHFYLHATGL